MIVSSYCILATNNFSIFQLSADCKVLFQRFCIFHCANFDTCTCNSMQCSTCTRLATCNFSENELIAKFARVFTSLKLPGIQYTSYQCQLLQQLASLLAVVFFCFFFVFFAKWYFGAVCMWIHAKKTTQQISHRSGQPAR